MSLKIKRENYKGRTLKWKEDVKNNNTYLDSEIFKLINCVVVSILNLFILRILGIRWLLQILYALIKMYIAFPYLSLKESASNQVI
jgi:hypothetical protein